MGNELASFVINEVWSVCVVRWRFCSLRMGDNGKIHVFRRLLDVLRFSFYI